MAVAGVVKLKKWTREEWRRLIDLGVLTKEDMVELLDGEIVEMSPEGMRHAGTTSARNPARTDCPSVRGARGVT